MGKFDWSQFSPKSDTGATLVESPESIAPETPKLDWSKFAPKQPALESDTPKPKLDWSKFNPEKKETLPEDNTGFLKSSADSFLSGLAQMQGGMARIPSLIYDAAATPQNLITKYVLGKPEQQVKSPDWLIDNPIAKMSDKAAESYSFKGKKFKDEDLGSLISKKNYSGAGEYLYHSVIENTPNTLLSAGLAASGVGEVAALGSLGAVSGAQNLKEGRDKGLEPIENAANAIVNGSLEGIFEKAGTFGLVKWGEEIFKTAGRKTGLQIVKDVFKTSIGSMLGEGNEELFTQIAQDFTDKVYGSSDIKAPLTSVAYWKESLARALEAGAVGAAAGGTSVGPVAMASGVRQAREEGKLKKIDEAIKTIRERKEPVTTAGEKSTEVRLEVPAEKVVLPKETTPPVAQAQIATPTQAEAIKASPEPPIAEKPAFKPFKISEVMDQPKSSLLRRSSYLAEELEKTNAPLTEKLSDLESQLNETEVIPDRARIREEMRGIQKKITQSQQNLQRSLNDDAEASIQSIMDYAGASGIRWPKIRQREFKNTLIERLTDETTPAETTPREVADELIKGYARVDAERAAAPKKPKTVIGYIRASGGIDPESVRIGGYNTDLDFKQQGAIGVLKNGGQKFDQMAKEMIEDGIIQEVEGQSPMETVLDAIKGRRKMLEFEAKSVEDELAKHEREQIEDMEAYERDKAQGLIPEGENPENTLEEIANSETEGEKEAARIDDEGVEFYQEKSSEEKQTTTPFFSQLERVIKEKMPNSAHVDHVKGILRNSGVKQEEMDWLDINHFLEGKEKVTKQELLDYIKSNDVKVEEVVKGGPSEPDFESDKKIYEASERNLSELVELNKKANTPALQERIDAIGRVMNKLDSKYGGDINKPAVTPTKFHPYQLPGGENYKELLLTLPQETSASRYQISQDLDGAWKVFRVQDGMHFGRHEEKGDALTQVKELNEKFNELVKEKSIFKSSHFEEPNILAHVRFNERTDADGKKVLFIEEIQSDWHQKGKKQGYVGDKKLPDNWSIFETKGATPSYQIHDENNRMVAGGFTSREEALKDFFENSFFKEARGEIGKVPNAPFKKTESWAGLALKRMLRYAAENGFDKIAWTTGEQQAERYDLSKHIQKVIYKRDQAEGELSAFDHDNKKVISQFVSQDKLSDFIGKEATQKLLESPPAIGSGGIKTYFLEGQDLKVGGEGMKGFYDQIIPSFLNKYTKKWGGRVGSTTIQRGEDRKAFDEAQRLGDSKKIADALGKPITVHSLEITPSMKESVMEGQPLFQQKPKDTQTKSTFAIEESKLKALLQRNKIQDVVIQLADTIPTPSGRGAYGSYTQGAKLVRMVAEPMKTTGYHEGFHVILREGGLLERIPELYDEIGTKNPKNAEELLADKFAEYANDRSSFKGKLRAFLDRVMDFIRTLLGGPSNKDKTKTLFEELYTGNYRPKQKPYVVETLFQEKDNPFLAIRTHQQLEEAKPLQAELREVVKKIEGEATFGKTNKGYEARRDFLVKELNKILSPKNNLEATKELKEFIAQQDFWDTELPPGGESMLGSADPKQLRDISGIEASLRDIYRNFKDVFGNQYELIKKKLLDHLDKSRGRFVDMQRAWTDELQKTVVTKLGIKPGSKMSAAVMAYGEGNINYDFLLRNFGPIKANNIVEADAWFRTAYDDILERVNSSIAKIYPGQSQRLIPRRSNYYRHFTEFSSLAGLMNIFDTPANIASSLAGISENTKPKSKWLSFAQQRVGIKTKVDAVKGFLEYLPNAAYAVHISPNIPRFRTLAKELRVATAKTPEDAVKIQNLYEAKRLATDEIQRIEIQGMIDSTQRKDHLNMFITFLDDFAGSLAGKTNPYFDRVMTKILGRKPITTLNWINSRIKANVILGNISSALSQFASIPLGVSKTKLYSILGMGDSMAQVFKKSVAMAQSVFLKTRYADSMYDKFDRGMMNSPKKLAKWLLTVADEISVKFIWNSAYEMGKGRGVADPVKYADDLTRELVAGRGVGEVPLLQQSKTFQLVAPFQLEVQNLIWVLGDMADDKDISALIVYMIMAYLFNNASELIKGQRVLFDPLNAAIEAFSGEKAPEQRIGRLIGEILSNVPGGGGIQGAYDYFALLNRLPRAKQIFGKSDTTRFGKGLFVEGIADPLYKIAPPFAGNQIKKTIGGNKAINQGYVVTGQKKIYVDDNLLNRLSATMFGKYSMPEVKEYFKNQEAKAQNRYMSKRG